MSDPMTDKDTLQLAFGRLDSVSAYWNIYIAVTFGILGLMAGAKGFTRNWRVKVVLTAAFIVFAASNLFAILELDAQSRALIDLVKSQYGAVVSTMEPSPFVLKAVFHVVMDVLVCLAIWLVPWNLSSDEPPVAGGDAI